LDLRSSHPLLQQKARQKLDQDQKGRKGQHPPKIKKTAGRMLFDCHLHRTRPPLVRKTIKNPLTRLTKESLDRAEKAGRNRPVRFDLIKQAWTTSTFRERVQFQREVGKLLTGTVAQQVIGDIGEACSTCRSRRRISTERTKEFARRIGAKAKAAARPRSEAREKSPLLFTEDEADEL